MTAPIDDTSTCSAECALAAQDGYQELHHECRQTKDIPLPHGAGLVLVRRCTCPCHTRIAGAS
ncbi:hypothetical protein R6V09_30425 [Streptomyces sp. W16]|uniref:hypothetical protein n=1 Tax=Streptomyces sp. W16 TaxID=3076631 RepID=UPI00295BBB10|nr:hypothetical protein [Streptomyces sp. W16]MDV9174411.1 hypothetical protein [Streptomyces sp. W16]